MLFSVTHIPHAGHLRYKQFMLVWRNTYGMVYFLVSVWLSIFVVAVGDKNDIFIICS